MKRKGTCQLSITIAATFSIHDISSANTNILIARVLPEGVGLTVVPGSKLPECVLGGIWLWEHLEVTLEVLDVLLALEGGLVCVCLCVLCCCYGLCGHVWFSKHLS